MTYNHGGTVTSRFGANLYSDNILDPHYEYKITKETLKRKQNKLRIFDFISTLNQLFGLTMVALVGYFFGVANVGYQWNTAATSLGKINFHCFAVVVGLVFFQGEGMLMYRHFRHESKIIFKFYQFFFNILGIALGGLLNLNCNMSLIYFAIAGFALAASVTYANIVNDPHFYSFQSWLLLAILAIYMFRVLLTFGIYTFPRCSSTIRESVKPYTLTLALLSFTLSTLYSLIVNAVYLTQNIYGNGAEGCKEDSKCPKHLGLIINFGMISTVFYSMTVCLQVTRSEWGRSITK